MVILCGTLPFDEKLVRLTHMETTFVIDVWNLKIWKLFSIKNE